MARTATKKNGNGDAATVSKSESIRQEYRATPKASAKEIIESLAKKGIEVSQALVQYVKYHPKKGAKGKRRGRPVSKKSVGLDLSGLQAAAKYVEQVGGFDAARDSITALEKVKNILG